MKKYSLLNAAILLLSFWAHAQSYVWTAKMDFAAGTRAGACGFSIGNLGYVACGVDQAGFGFIAYNDLWQYNPQTDAWTQLADLPSSARSSASSFEINGMGYVCLGFDLSNYLNDLWQYNPALNSWSQKSSFPGAARYTAASFVINDTAYVGSGKSGGYYLNFYKYDAVNDAWTQIADLGGSPRQNARGFTIGNSGYVVGGAFDPGGNYFDLWQYSPQTGSWIQKTSYPGLGCYAGCAFVLNGLAYVGTGSTQVSIPNTYDDFYTYDPVADSWTPFIPFGGGLRNSAVCFSIGNKAYMGIGSTGIYPAGSYTEDWWELSQTTGINETANAVSSYVSVQSNEIFFHFNKTIDKPLYLELYDATGKEIKKYLTGNNIKTYEVMLPHVGRGLYIYSFYGDKKMVCSGKFFY